jgi:hypothetical protein
MVPARRDLGGQGGDHDPADALHPRAPLRLADPLLRSDPARDLEGGAAQAPDRRAGRLRSGRSRSCWRAPAPRLRSSGSTGIHARSRSDETRWPSPGRASSSTTAWRRGPGPAGLVRSRRVEPGVPPPRHECQARQQRVGDLVGAHDVRARTGDGRASGHRLVDRAVALEHDAVDRRRLAAVYAQLVADLDLTERDVGLGAVLGDLSCWLGAMPRAPT